MPVKNTKNFLRECLDSILKQTLTNWELIAVNDHSTDNTLKILEEYALKDNRISVYTNQGNGIIKALRLAYEKSSGECITRMDADDIMDKNKLATLQQNLMKRGRGNIAVGLVKYFSENNHLGEGFKRYEDWLNELTRTGTNFNAIYKECVIPSPCWMVYKQDLNQCEAFQPNKYPEDYDLAFRFYQNKLQTIPCDTVLHYWRDYAARTSRNDINYADNTFLEIKLDYFLKLEHDATKNLVIWGAGTKGKTVAKRLLKENISFNWICDNPKKIGKDIYGQKLLAFTTLEELENTQSIITVANVNAQQEIKRYFQKRNSLPLVDYFFFC